MNYKEIDKIFYRDGYRLALQYLDRDLSSANLRSGITRLYLAVDELLEAFLQRTAIEGKPAACKMGCKWCCHQAVFAVTHEFLYLQDHVKHHLQEKIQKKILEKAREKVKLTLHKSIQEQVQVRIPCPFLESDSCLVYQARPMACRIYLSSSVEACIKEYKEPNNERSIPDLFEFPLRAGRMLNEGFVSFLKQTGLQNTELSLEQGYSSMATIGQTMEDWIENRSLN